MYLLGLLQKGITCLKSIEIGFPHSLCTIVCIYWPYEFDWSRNNEFLYNPLLCWSLLIIWFPLDDRSIFISISTADTPFVVSPHWPRTHVVFFHTIRWFQHLNLAKIVILPKTHHALFINQRPLCHMKKWQSWHTLPLVGSDNHLELT